MGKEYDLGRDNLTLLTLKLSLPTALAQAVNVLYAIVDRMFIGHIPEYGDIALAGVGVAAPITTLISSFAVLVGLGGAPIMAMKEGHGDHEDAERIVSTGFAMLLIISLILTPFFFILRVPILSAFGASETTIRYAEEYFAYYLIGTPLALLATGLNSFVINQGLSKKGMISVLSGAALNIVLDPVFIFLLGLGVKGAAIASVISQALSAAIAIGVLLSSRTAIRLRISKPSAAFARKIAAYGLSPFIIIGTDSLLMILLNRILQSYGGPGYGDTLITCSTIIQSYHLLVMNTLGGITAGCQGLVSYNYGAGNTDRVRIAIRNVQIVATAYTVLMLIATIFGAGGFASFFTDAPEIMALSAKYMIAFELMIIPLSFQYNTVDMLTALGQVRLSLPLSLARKIEFFIALLVLPPIFGAESAFFAEPVCDIIAGTTAAVVMRCMLGRILAERTASGLNI